MDCPCGGPRQGVSVDVLRNVVIWIHLIGFAVTFGGWAAEALARRFRTTAAMDYGLLVSLISGVVLAAPWPAGVETNWPKVGLKLAILIVLGGVLGAGNAKQRRTGRPVPRPLFYAVGVLSLLAAGIGVIW